MKQRCLPHTDEIEGYGDVITTDVTITLWVDVHFLTTKIK